MGRPGVLVGDKFERLSVRGVIPGCGNRLRRYICDCQCGNVIQVIANVLLSGVTRSCGCLRRACPLRGHVKHGDARRSGVAREYTIWREMIRRCSDAKGQSFHRYGGRGISVCQRWMEYPNFLADMGRRPTAKHSIDRINNDGNYEPSNCRWATPKEQAANTRRSIVRLKPNQAKVFIGAEALESEG